MYGRVTRPLLDFSERGLGTRLGVAKYNSFWTGDDDGMAQKYMDRACPQNPLSITMHANIDF